MFPSFWTGNLYILTSVLSTDHSRLNMPTRNQKKQVRLGEKDLDGCSSDSIFDMATSTSHEAGAAGPAVGGDTEMESAAFDELGHAPSTTALAKYLKEAMRTFQSMLDKAVKSVVESA